jgi:hypothetical protein
MPMPSHSPLESERFGLQVYRFNASHAEQHRVDPIALQQFLFEQRVDVAMLRLSAEVIENASLLGQLGLPVLHTHTMAQNVLELAGREFLPLRNPEMEVVPATLEDKQLLHDMAMAAYKTYPYQHYAANPLLKGADLAAGVAEWAVSHLTGEGKKVYLFRLDGQWVGFMCTLEDAESARYHLGGVLPELRKGGIFSDIYRILCRDYVARGLKRVYLSVALQNVGSQRAFDNLATTRGTVSYEYTYHINALFSAGEVVRRAEGNSAFVNSSTQSNLYQCVLQGRAMAEVVRTEEVRFHSLGSYKVQLRGFDAAGRLIVVVTNFM